MAQISEEKNKAQEKQKKEIAKAYGKYAKEFTPKPKYFSNCLKAFIVGGAICTAAFAFQTYLQGKGISGKRRGCIRYHNARDACPAAYGAWGLRCNCKVRRSGRDRTNNRVFQFHVAPALEYKREGPVPGVGAKLFSVAGPVLVCGISAATIVGVIYWLM